MFRRLWIALVAVCTLAVAIAGIISFWRGLPEDAIWIETSLDRPEVSAAIVRGRIHLVYSRPCLPAEGVPRASRTAGAGFYVETAVVGNTVAKGVGLPFWAVLLAPTAYLFLALLRGPLARRRRRRLGQCLRCGYSLVGLTGSRCPECGTSFYLLPPAIPGRP